MSTGDYSCHHYGRLKHGARRSICLKVPEGPCWLWGGLSPSAASLRELSLCRGGRDGEGRAASSHPLPWAWAVAGKTPQVDGDALAWTGSHYPSSHKLQGLPCWQRVPLDTRAGPRSPRSLL